jgi:ABC-2 type transport system ATP-binding protein
MTLVGSPRVFFLDEPTTGLDARSRRTMWEVLRALAASGVTIFLTTQYLDEADELADRIAVLDHGAIVASGTPVELKRRLPNTEVELRFADAASFAEARALLDVRDADEHALVLQVSSHTPNLDDVFFSVTEKR